MPLAIPFTIPSTGITPTVNPYKSAHQSPTKTPRLDRLTLFPPPPPAHSPLYTSPPPNSTRRKSCLPSPLSATLSPATYLNNPNPSLLTPARPTATPPLTSPYKPQHRIQEDISWLRPWSWPLVAPIVDVFIPLQPTTIEASRPFTSTFFGGTTFGYLPYLLYPLNPVFHACWWNGARTGVAFVEQLDDETGLLLDEKELVSPGYGGDDTGRVVWPWEKVFRKRKKGGERQVRKKESYLEEEEEGALVYDDLDVSTPKWQRYYEKASTKIEDYASKIMAEDEVLKPDNKSDNGDFVSCEYAGETEVRGVNFLDEMGKMFGDGGAKKKKKSHKKKKKEERGEAVEATVAVAPQPQQLPLPPVTEWPDRPLYCRYNFSSHSHPQTHSTDMPLNKTGSDGFVEFETSVFKGRMSFAVADLERSEVKEMFRGKRRRYRYVVIGKFKRRLNYSEVYTGLVIKQMKTNRGTEWLMRSMRWMMKSVSPSMRETVDGEGNKVVMSPIAATAQRMAVSTKSEKVSEDGMNVEEDLTSLGDTFVGKKGRPLDSEARKTAMCKPEELSKHFFEVDEEYTMEFYQHLFDPVTFHMNVVGMTTFDVASVLGDQPVRIVSKLLSSDEYLWDIEMWHERLLLEATSSN